jgi:hypothetical protein
MGARDDPQRSRKVKTGKSINQGFHLVIRLYPQNTRETPCPVSGGIKEVLPQFGNFTGTLGAV